MPVAAIAAFVASLLLPVNSPSPPTQQTLDTAEDAKRWGGGGVVASHSIAREKHRQIRVKLVGGGGTITRQVLK